MENIVLSVWSTASELDMADYHEEFIWLAVIEGNIDSINELITFS